MATNIIPFPRRPANDNDRPPPGPAYATGVTPFDQNNPAHVRAWNTVWAIGLREAGRI